MPLVKIPAVRGVQNGTEVFVALIPASIYAGLNIVVERYSPEKVLTAPDQGYQRSADNNRANRFKRYLDEEGAISPTSILLNDRDSKTRYDKKEKELVFDTGTPLYNYDGQHRGLGYQAKFRQDEDEFGGFPIPVVITRGIPKLTEMVQFQTINRNAKKMSTSLVDTILAQVQATEGDEAIASGSHRGVVSIKVVEKLHAKADSPWQGMIILSNDASPTKKAIREDPALARSRIIHANSFVDSLRPVYEYMATLDIGETLNQRTDRIYEAVKEFWAAIKEKMPAAFDAPRDYALFRSAGIGPLHLVLRQLLVRLHSANIEFARENFGRIIGDDADLTSETFWRSDNEEGAVTYAGGKPVWPEFAKKLIRDMDESREPASA